MYFTSLVVLIPAKRMVLVSFLPSCVKLQPTLLLHLLIATLFSLVLTIGKCNPKSKNKVII